MDAVHKKTGDQAGPTVAVFGGVHGNERVGVNTVRDAVESLDIAAGTLYLVEANPPAIEQNVRAVGKNLNRCFLDGNTGDTPEDERARELMALLDTCDALLDIHSSNSADAVPFVICERDCLPIAEKLDFSIISFGWDAVEPGGSDGYMFRNGKIGICVECGSSFDAESNQHLADNALRVFLAHFGMLADAPDFPDLPHRYIQVHTMGHKQTDAFAFDKSYSDFETLTADAVFATDGDKQYTAADGDCIIFPRPDTAIGGEAFILGRELASPDETL